ncbi:MAG: YhgE/Pip domain-containing protein [Anaerolineaceae bacterium]|nr:YhgE/Pip domain-containing protein [Anaerolineaceae bacterium]
MGNFLAHVRATFNKSFPTLFSRVAVFAVAIIPLIYGALYLYAFWDPYNRVEDLPVAFVTQDLGGVTGNGDYKNLGLELQYDLETDHNLKWAFVTLDQANQGLQDKKYYSYILIPEDFTQNILSADSSHPKKGNLILRSREASGVISAKIVNAAAVEISDKLSHTITKEYFNNIFVDSRNNAQDIKKAVNGAQDLSKGLADAKNGSQKLANGIADAWDGGKDLNSGVQTALNGSQGLSNGISDAYDGSTTLQVGLVKLKAGTQTLSTNIAAAYTGIKTLDTGASAAAKAASNILGGIKQLAPGSEQITAALKQIGAQTGDLPAGITTLENGLASLKAGADKTADAANSLNDLAGSASGTTSSISDTLASLLNNHPDLKDDDDIKNLQNEIGALQAQQGGISSYAGGVKSGIAQIQGGAGQLVSASAQLDGITQLAASLPQLIAGSESVTTGLGTVQDGQSQLVAGLNTLVAGQETLTDGLDQLKAGAVKVNDGAKTAVNGSAQLQDGLSTLKDGGKSLVNGMWDLSDGSKKLENGLSDLSDNGKKLVTGLGDATDGSNTLYYDLNDGYVKSVGKVSTAAATKEEPVLSDPVNLQQEMVDPVKTYGSGFAPYFIPLALWVGAMTIFLIVPPMTNLEAKKHRRIFGLFGDIVERYLLVALIAIAQALLLATVLIKFLGLQPIHLKAFYLFAILLSLLSAAIFQCLTYLFGLAGDFIGIVVLMLQLTSSGGSYPKETLPQFFQTISPYLPMTYAVSAFRDIISGSHIAVMNIFYMFMAVIPALILTTTLWKWIFARNLGKLKLETAAVALVDDASPRQKQLPKPQSRRIIAALASALQRSRLKIGLVFKRSRETLLTVLLLAWKTAKNGYAQVLEAFKGKIAAWRNSPKRSSRWKKGIRD